MSNTVHDNDTIHSSKLIHMQDQKMPCHNCSTSLYKAKPLLYIINGILIPKCKDYTFCSEKIVTTTHLIPLDLS